MEDERNDQTDRVSDHQKFGESSAFGGTDAEAPKVYDQAEETARSARDKAVQLRGQLADRLETGASRLRQRTSNTAKLDEAIASTKQRVAGASDRVATGMERSADWLRTANVETFQRRVEQGVRQNPGRALLVAGAIGYLLGRAFKGRGD